jgi:hypothetical protein
MPGRVFLLPENLQNVQGGKRFFFNKKFLREYAPLSIEMSPAEPGLDQ